MGSFFDILRQQYSQNGSLGVGTRSEVHPRLFWLACSLINLGTFLLFLKEKLTIQALMITTAHDRPFPEFPSIMNESSSTVAENSWVHLSPINQRTMPTLCHQHHNDPATHRRDDGQQPGARKGGFSSLVFPRKRLAVGAWAARHARRRPRSRERAPRAHSRWAESARTRKAGAGTGTRAAGRAALRLLGQGRGVEAEGRRLQTGSASTSGGAASSWLRWIWTPCS